MLINLIGCGGNDPPRIVGGDDFTFQGRLTTIETVGILNPDQTTVKFGDTDIQPEFVRLNELGNVIVKFRPGPFSLGSYLVSVQWNGLETNEILMEMIGEIPINPSGFYVQAIGPEYGSIGTEVIVDCNELGDEVYVLFYIDSFQFVKVVPVLGPETNRLRFQVPVEAEIGKQFFVVVSDSEDSSENAFTIIDPTP